METIEIPRERWVVSLADGVVVARFELPASMPGVETIAHEFARRIKRNGFDDAIGRFIIPAILFVEREDARRRVRPRIVRVDVV
jgi:hypothetical protein